MNTVRFHAVLLFASAGLLTPTASANDYLPLHAVMAQKPNVIEKGSIVSFISPGHLFPVEGTAFFRRDNAGAPETYRPLTAYDKPNGAKIGDVTMLNAPCVGDPTAAGCELGYAWYLQMADGSRYQLSVAEYSYETEGLLSYSPSIHDRNTVWSEIGYAKGSFWVATNAEEVIDYEHQVHVVDHFDTWCDTPERCVPVSRQMSAEVLRVRNGEFKLASCYPQPYEVAGIVTINGARYYKVTLSKVDDGSTEPKLPKSGFIPVRNKDGSHTGTFYSRGC